MTIRQAVFVNAGPEDVFKALLNAEAFASFTGAPAEIDATVGGAFSCFDGQITGRNIEIEPNKRIVQAWRAGPWEEGFYSIVRFDLAADDKGTTITLQQTGYPDGSAEHLDGGWHKMYWEPLKSLLN